MKYLILLGFDVVISIDTDLTRGYNNTYSKYESIKGRNSSNRISAGKPRKGFFCAHFS